MLAVLHKIRQPALFILFFSILIANLLAPLASNQFVPQSFDLFNHLAQILQAAQSLTDGQFPLRDAVIDGQGWRYPVFQFYAPTSYYCAALLYKIIGTNNPFIAYKLTLFFSLLMGAVYFYRLAFLFIQSSIIAVLCTTLFLLSPYFMILINHIGGFNETIALCILPIVLYYCFVEFKPYRFSSTTLKLTLAWFALITTHLITFVYSSLFIAILFTLKILKNRNQQLYSLNIVMGYSLACALAMWYLAPIVYLSDSFNVAESFQKMHTMNVPLLSLFALNATYQNPALGNNQIVSNFNPAIGWLVVCSAGLTLIALSQRKYRIEKPIDEWLPYFFICFCLAVFMIWTPFNFWKLLPNVLTAGQYTWRILGQAIWLGALLAGFAMSSTLREPLNNRYLIIGTLIILICNSAWLPVTYQKASSVDAFLKDPKLMFSPSMYLLNPTKHPEWISAIHNVNLKSLVDNNVLQTEQHYIIPYALFQYTKKPEIIVNLDNKNAAFNSSTITLSINHRIIASHPIKMTSDTWIIPLNKDALSEAHNDLDIQFIIHSNKTQTSQPTLAVHNILLSGFELPNTLIPATESIHSCKNIGSTTQCILNIPAGIQNVELPIHYYPAMLSITLNGKAIHYSSLLDLEKAVVSITPEAGKQNIIISRFVGLRWANGISILTCVFLLFSFLMLMLRTYYRKN